MSTHLVQSKVKFSRLKKTLHRPLFLPKLFPNSIVCFTSCLIRILRHLNPTTCHNAGWSYHIRTRDEGGEELHLHHVRIETTPSFYVTSTQPHATTLSEQITYARVSREGRNYIARSGPCRVVTLSRAVEPFMVFTEFSFIDRAFECFSWIPW